MEFQELDPSGLDGCDESKCVSQGGWNHFSNDTSESFMNPFTCYGDEGTFYPKMCSDGFVPVTVKEESTLSSADWYGFVDANISVSYFTCCPSNLAKATTNATRRCSNPIVTPTNPSSKDEICGDEGTFIHPRPMKANTLRLKFFGASATFYESTTGIDSHVCCNYDIAPSLNVDFRNVTECVPYRSEGYDGFFQENRIGAVWDTIVPIQCNFPDGSFSIPRPSSTSLYQCCKSGTAMPTYIQDYTFNVNVYPTIVLFGISTILSVIIIIGLTIPLIKDRKNKRNRPRRTSQRTRDPRFSPYNVYLIYLAFLDLIWCMYGVVVRGLYINQVIVPYDATIGVAIGLAYMVGNFWINAIILYEVFLLLKSSKSAQRKNPPSLQRMNLQAGLVYTVAVAYGIFLGLYLIPAPNGYTIGLFVQAFLTTPPLMYVCGLPFWIKWNNYLAPLAERGSVITTRSSSTGRVSVEAMRDKAIWELTLYFFRVVFVFVVLYLPISINTFVTKPWKMWPAYVNECVLAIQPAVTFAFILTKPDVKKYILDLVTLSYLFGNETTKNTMKPKAAGEKTHSTLRDSEKTGLTIENSKSVSRGGGASSVSHGGDVLERNVISGVSDMVEIRENTNVDTNDLDADLEEAMNPDDSDRILDSKHLRFSKATYSIGH